jgi:hypothetical protein
VSSIKKERGALLENPIDWLIKVMENVFDNHLPLVDVDGDTFTCKCKRDLARFGK